MLRAKKRQANTKDTAKLGKKDTKYRIRSIKGKNR